MASLSTTIVFLLSDLELDGLPLIVIAFEKSLFLYQNLCFK